MNSYDDRNMSLTAAIKSQERLRDEAQAALDQGRKEFKLSDDHVLMAPHVKAYNSANDSIAQLSLEKRALEAEEQTRYIVEDIIREFGTCQVADVTNVAVNVTLSGISEAIDEVRARRERDDDRQEVLCGLSDAIDKVLAHHQLAPDVLADMRPMRFVPDGDSCVRVEQGTTRTATRAAASSSDVGEYYRLVSAPESHQQLIGTTIGVGLDYTSARALGRAIRETLPELDRDWDHLTRTSTGKPRSLSWINVVLPKYGFRFERRASVR